MSVYKRPDSPWYHYDFQWRGRRFSGSTREGDRGKARAFERAERQRVQSAAAEEARAPAQNGPGDPARLTFTEAAALYQDHIGDDPAADSEIARAIGRLVDWIGPATRIVEIDDALVGRIIAARRAAFRWDRPVAADGTPGRPLSNTTVNRQVVDLLRPILRHARKARKLALPQEPDWSAHRLAEPRGRTRELRFDEEALLESAEREDYRPARLFAQITALRLREVVGLIWPQVDFWNREIRVVGKGDKLHVVPMTQELRALLEPLRGHHPLHVFTYVARRSYFNAKARRFFVAGQRYPITRSGLTSRRKRDFAAAGVADLTWHDLRHTGLSRIVRKTGSLRVAQELANHSTIRTTERYAHVLRDDVRRAMEAVSAEDAERRRESRENSRASPTSPPHKSESQDKATG